MTEDNFQFKLRNFEYFIETIDLSFEYQKLLKLGKPSKNIFGFLLEFFNKNSSVFPARFTNEF